jgi:hypothetical protein
LRLGVPSDRSSALDPEVIDVETLSDEQIAHALWREGDLAWKLHDHQRSIYDHYREWEGRSLDDEGQSSIYVLDCARRFGKTFLTCLIKTEDCLRRPGAIHTYATAYSKDIGEVVIPLMEQICDDGPEDVRPEYRGSHAGQNSGFYFPNGSVIRLVGIDLNPKAIRGRASDGYAVTEASFIKDLARTIVSKILPQFQRRPWARMILESSAPEDPDHDFDAVFVPDAKRRNAYAFRTIDDNTELTEEQRRKYYAESAAISKAEADRELYGVRSRDFDFVVIPEWDPERHVQEWTRPSHAYALGAHDPGYRHLYGMVWAYYDFAHATIVVEDSWAGSNASTARAACIVAARELALYGNPPPSSLDFIPLEGTGRRLGWKDYLYGDRCAHLAEDLHDMATTPPTERPDFETRPGRWVREDRPGQWTHWDNEGRHEFMPNPHARVADVDLKLISDMRETFGYEFQATTKQELRTMVNNLRRWFSSGRIVFLPTAGPVIDHVRQGKWSADRKSFAEHRSYGHVDCLSALNYLCRYAEYIENKDPMPPPGLDRVGARPSDYMVERLPWQPETAYEAEIRQRIERAEMEAAEIRRRQRDVSRLRPSPRMRSR